MKKSKKGDVINYWVLTIFPEIIDNFLNEGVIARAQKNKLIKVNTIDIRKFTDNKQNKVDDHPYGGGPGMIMTAQPLRDALIFVQKKIGSSFTIFSKAQRIRRKVKLIYTSPKGQLFEQKTARDFSLQKHIVIICGRYEGIDHRIEQEMDELISVGPYVLSGGELAASIMLDATSRLIGGVLGNEESIVEESQDGEKEFPQYTRPVSIKIGKKQAIVPEVLLSGNHKKIEEWRKAKKLEA